MKRLKIIAAVLATLAAILVVSAAIFYTFERAANPGMSFLDALYWAFITATTIGYGDITPTTIPGRIVAVVAAIAGIAAFTALIGVVADALVDSATRRVLGVSSIRKRGHIVVLGWSPLTPILIREIKANIRDADIVVVDEKVPLTVGDDVQVVRGDPLDREALEKASISQARYIVVAEIDDSRAVLEVLHARRANKQAKIIAMVVDSENVDILRQAGADHVVPVTIAAMLAASFIFEPSVPQVLIDLASSVIGIADVVEEDASQYVGKQFGDVLLEAKRRQNKIPIAVYSAEKGLLVNPPWDYVVSEGDRLISIISGNQQLGGSDTCCKTAE